MRLAQMQYLLKELVREVVAGEGLEINRADPTRPILRNTGVHSLQGAGGSTVNTARGAVVVTSPATSTAPAQAVATANSAGTSLDHSAADHQHAGVAGLQLNSNAQQLGGINLSVTGAGGSAVTVGTTSIEVSSPATGFSTPAAISSTGSPGGTGEHSDAGHTHAGVGSLSVNGGAAQQGAISLSAVESLAAADSNVVVGGSSTAPTVGLAASPSVSSLAASGEVSAGSLSANGLTLNAPTTTSALSGNFAMPANVAGFVEITIGGQTHYLPYF